MKIMVTGGRGYGVLDPRKVLEHPKRRAEIARLTLVLDGLLNERGVDLLIHGDEPRGADSRAKAWALSRNVLAKAFPANWDALGRAAGPIRNQAMVDAKPDLVVAFPGGRGTADAVARARKAGIEVMAVA